MSDLWGEKKGVRKEGVGSGIPGTTKKTTHSRGGSNGSPPIMGSCPLKVGGKKDTD